jgi:DNA-binding transcriptional MocR family regulator|mmetsp:Transcript_27676/g.68364  ORF Transcript_27676/g.68364 Transcript_27676/m.68364 type:complete len:96 (+) Transcript_27676:31-318(+)|eukprot:5743274-Prymnesium_polylepis.1
MLPAERRRVGVCALASQGYFLWVDLRGVDASELRDRCAASHGVTFLPGARCALDAAVAPSHARVCFAFLEEDDLVEAGRRLGRAIAQAWEVPARQ